MEKRTKYLLNILAVCYIAMALFLALNYEAGADQIIFSVIFGLLLISFAFFGVKIEKNIFREKGIVKVIFSSVALAFLLMIVISLIAMLFIGYGAFDIIFGKNAGIIWLVLLIAVSPIALKYIK